MVYGVQAFSLHAAFAYAEQAADHEGEADASIDTPVPTSASRLTPMSPLPSLLGPASAPGFGPTSSFPPLVDVPTSFVLALGATSCFPPSCPPERLPDSRQPTPTHSMHHPAPPSRPLFLRTRTTCSPSVMCCFSC